MQMQYKGFKARHHYVPDAGVYVGEITNAPDVISFSAQNLTSLYEVMMEAVESYLELVQSFIVKKLGLE